MIDEKKLIDLLESHKTVVKEKWIGKRGPITHKAFIYYIDKLIECINGLKVEED